MTAPLNSLPMTAMHDHLRAVAADIEARTLLAVDLSGNVIDVVGDEKSAPTLAALSAANLAATHEITELAGIEADAQWPQTLLIEGKHGGVMLAEGRQAMNFIAILSASSVVGLARLEMRRLALMVWTEPEPDQSASPIDLAAEWMSNLDIDL